MLRLIFTFAAILLIAYISATLVDYPGSVTIDFGPYRMDTSLAALALLASVLMVLSGATVWLVGWMKHDMPVVGKNRIFKRQARGLQLLNKSLVALSAGDHKLAGRLIGQAEVLLPPQPMVHLIAAEAATRSGDYDKAAELYKLLKETEEGRLLGLRGLLMDARRKGAEREALKLARLAFKENRKSPWVIKTLFALEVAAANWPEAIEALKISVRELLVDEDHAKSHKASLHYAEAMEHMAAGRGSEARKLLLEAIKAKADFPSAKVALVRMELNDGNTRRANKLLMDAWKAAPHPLYVSAYKVIDASESRDDWLKRARKLVEKNPDHGESKLLLVDAMMDARQYDGVRPVLEDLLQTNPGRRALQYRLAFAHATGEDADPIEASLETAIDRASWLCEDCGTKHHAWAVLCPTCKGFDTIIWVTADKAKKSKHEFDSVNTIALLSDDEFSNMPFQKVD